MRRSKILLTIGIVCCGVALALSPIVRHPILIERIENSGGPFYLPVKLLKAIFSLGAEDGDQITWPEALREGPLFAGYPIWAWLLIIGLPLTLYWSWRLVSESDQEERSGEPAYTAKQFTQSKSAEPVATIPNVSFTDVAGCDEAVEEVHELVAFLQDPEPFLRLGAKMPSGVILHGPPGTGKTLIAKALAGEAEVPFFATSGSEFIEMYVGVGASRIRQLFSSARKCPQGAVMFIDEIDAVGGKRSEAGGITHRESDQTLNQLLSEMDGFEENERLVIIAATNRVDILDAALTRPGRFSRQVEVQLPDRDGRRQILAVHSKGRPLAADVDLDSLATMTAGISGAELAETINEAAIWAARNQQEQINNDDIFEGLCRVIAGPRRQALPDDQEQLKTVAIHEAGHALCAELCQSHPPTQHLTVQPRGRALGFALQGKTDRALIDEEELHERLMMILGGRAAEYVVLGKVSSGAANDLVQASNLARQAIEEWGLGSIGQISGRLAEKTKAISDSEVSRLVDQAYNDAVTLLTNHIDQLNLLAEALLSQETLSRQDLDQLLGHLAAIQHRPATTHRPSKILDQQA